MLRFLQVVFIVQMPHLNLFREAEKVKGEALNEQEKNELNKRAEYAFRWLRNVADEKFHNSLRKVGVGYYQTLSPNAQSFLNQIALSLDFSDSWLPEDIQKVVFDTIKTYELEPKEGFSYIYQLFLSKDSGPQLGWFLNSLERSFVINRLRGVV